jgi:AcrR family transcriptional regulator
MLPDEMEGLVRLWRPLRRELIVASRGEGGEDALARELGAGLRRLPDIHDDDLAGRVLRDGMADQALRRLAVEVYSLGNLLVLGARGGMADLIIQRGYAATTMADIAAAAGVAVQTLYFTFHTKAELLQNVYELAVLGEGDRIPPDQQPWWAEMRAAERLEEALRLLVDNVTSILARAAPLDDFVRAASFDPDPARVRAHNERLRRESYAQVVEHLDARFGLRPGLTPTQATDILLLLLGPATYQTLVGEYGWPQERWRSWCAASISELLSATAAHRRPER